MNASAIPDNFHIMHIDIRGDVMYIEGTVRDSGKIQTIPIKIGVKEEGDDFPQGVKQL